MQLRSLFLISELARLSPVSNTPRASGSVAEGLRTAFKSFSTGSPPLQMSRKGDCWDSEAVENYFGKVATARVHVKDCTTRERPKRTCLSTSNCPVIESGGMPRSAISMQNTLLTRCGVSFLAPVS